jgi:hypothetical protein
MVILTLVKIFTFSKVKICTSPKWSFWHLANFSLLNGQFDHFWTYNTFDRPFAPHCQSMIANHWLPVRISVLTGCHQGWAMDLIAITVMLGPSLSGGLFFFFLVCPIRLLLFSLSFMNGIFLWHNYYKIITRLSQFDATRFLQDTKYFYPITRKA